MSGDEQSDAGGERVGEQPLGRAADERDQGAERAGQGRDRVVGAEELRPLLDGGGVREHRLLERGEGPGLDDLGRDGPAETGEDERRQPTGQREDAAGNRHGHEEQAVAVAPSDAVAVARDEDRDERAAGQERGEHEPDGPVGEAAFGEVDADKDRAEAVCERPCGLDRDDPAGIGAQARSSNTSAPPRSGQNTYRQRLSGSQPSVCAPCSVATVSSGSRRSLSKLQTTPGSPIATYRRASSASCMTTSGTPGSGRLASSSPLSRSTTASTPPSAAQKRRPRSSQSPCGPAVGTGSARSISRLAQSMTTISAGSRMFAWMRSRSSSYTAHRGRPGRASSPRTHIESRSTTEAVEPSPSGPPRMN